MPQYDGAIRIATKITTKDAEESLASLEWQIKKSAKYMDELRAKMDTLKDQKVPTQEYKDLEKELEAAYSALNSLVEKQKEYKGMGFKDEDIPKTLTSELDKAGLKVGELEEKIQKLNEEGKAFTLGRDTEQYKAMERQLQYEEESVRKASEHYKKLLKSKDAYKNLGDTAKKSFNAINNMLKKANSLIDSFASRIKKAFLNFKKTSDSANKSAFGISSSLKNILKYGFGIRSLYVLVNKLGSAIKEGFSNLLEYSEPLKNSIDNLKASALTLKNAFAAAFSPFVEIAIPYVQKLLDYMTQLINMAGQFFAALTGRKTYIKAIKQTTAALEDETKAMNKQLSPLDKLNNLSSENAKASAGAGGTMFEEVPIDSKFLELADKMKDIFSKLFAPLKEAWDREGKFVMDSWKYALDEVWKLIKDIGRDFLTVWQEEATIKIFQNLLHIIGDIGLIVGNLARNFRAAWNENEVGLKILRNIRDIIGIIVQHIRNAADATVEWSDKLDFYPLLDAFNRFLESLKPVVDALSGILEDFYAKVLLPLGKWVLEKGLPELLQVFIDFNNKVDWEALRANLAEFWEHLEPFAETIGEGLIIFIGRLADALANFVNSQEFKDFLVTLENWMDSVTPEDVADALESIAKGLIALKVALLGFGAISAITGVLTTIKTFLSFFGVGGGASAAAGGMLGTAEAASGLSLAIGGLTTALAAVAAAVAGWYIGSWIAEKLELDPKPFNETMQSIKDSFTDGSWKEALNLWADDIKLAFATLGSRIGESWNKTWESIKKTVQSALDWINSKINAFGAAKSALGGGLGGALGGAISGKSTFSLNPAMAALSNVEFPAYATGQVIPTSMKQHLAWLGDNPRETEVVSPLSTIEQAVMNAMEKFNGGAGGGNVTVEIPVIIDGIGEIGRAVQQFDREFFKQTGRHAFT